MQVEYEKPVSEEYFKIKCIPGKTDRQKIYNLDIRLKPYNGYSSGYDCFGNNTIYGNISESHNFFSFRITGDAQTGLSDYENTDNEGLLMMYRHPGRLTHMGEMLERYYLAHKPEGDRNMYEWVMSIMHGLHNDLTYEKDVTDINTTAEKALGIRKGVCQDFAHIMVALCRRGGLPSRYVTGMLIGEGYSHAWAEVLCNGRWYGFDPTNDVVVSDSHIKIGVGRDAYDCQVNRGIIRGGGSQRQTIEVNVIEI